MIRKPPLGKNTFIRNVSSCVINRYNGYDIVKIAQKDCIISCFSPLDIVYDPIEDPNKIIKCYFTDNIHFAFRLKCSRRKRLGDSDMRIDKIHQYECQSCNKFSATKKGNDGHVATCPRSVGIVYKLGNKSLISFKDNYCLLGDLLFVVYFDFETTLGKDLFQDKKCTF